MELIIATDPNGARHLVAATSTYEDFTTGYLCHTAPEQATEPDVLCDGDRVSYTVILQGDLPVTLVPEQIVEHKGHLEPRWPDIRASHLAGPSDGRWAFKVDQGYIAQRLSVPALSRVWADDE